MWILKQFENVTFKYKLEISADEGGLKIDSVVLLNQIRSID